MLKEIILSQKNTLYNILGKKYILRDSNLNLEQNNPLIKVIIGPRRSGKSYFAIHQLKGTGNFGYVNFDEERFSEVTNYDEIIYTVNSVYNNPKFLLLDEIQNLNKWELFVNRLQREGFSLVITGSNSNLLSSELAAHLTGRYLPFYILPFSFNEYLKTVEAGTRTNLKNSFLNYMETGGFPELILFDIDFNNYIDTLKHSIVLKDIISRYKLRLVNDIEKLANYILVNSGSEFSYSGISKHITIKSDKTVEKYIRYFENAFLVFQISRFSYKYKNQLSYNKKIYAYDNSFLRGNEFFYGINKGKLLENLLAIHLKKNEFATNEKLFFYRTRNNLEVDFLIEKNGKILKLIQVCYDLSNSSTYNRETRSLLIAGRELNCSDLEIINLEKESVESFIYSEKKQKIKFRLAYDFFN